MLDEDPTQTCVSYWSTPTDVCEVPLTQPHQHTGFVCRPIRWEQGFLSLLAVWIDPDFSHGNRQSVHSTFSLILFSRRCCCLLINLFFRLVRIVSSAHDPADLFSSILALPSLLTRLQLQCPTAAWIIYWESDVFGANDRLLFFVLHTDQVCIYNFLAALRGTTID